MGTAQIIAWLIVAAIALSAIVYVLSNSKPSNIVNVSGPLPGPVKPSAQEVKANAIMAGYNAPAFQLAFVAKNRTDPPSAKDAEDIYISTVQPKLQRNNKFINAESTTYWDDPLYVRYFAYPLMVTRPMKLSVYCGADNVVEFYLNGEFKHKKEGWRDTDPPTVVDVMPGPNVFEFVLTNTGGPGGLVVAVYDEAESLVFNSANPGWKTKK